MFTRNIKNSKIMKIVAPLSNIDCYESLVEAGGDEFFMGIVPYLWQKEFINNCVPLNRREYILTACNNFSFDSFKILRRKIEKHKAEVKITFNSHYYNEGHYPIIMDVIKRLNDHGFNNLIIGDIALILYLKEHNVDCKIHLSGEHSIPNRYSLNYYKDLCISRLVFPRKTTLSEIKSIIENSTNGIKEYEAFVLNDICYFSGALCNSFHCEELQNFCSIVHATVKNRTDSEKFSKEYNLINKKNQILKLMLTKSSDTVKDRDDLKLNFGETGCGLCRIKELQDMGVTHLKVVGRGRHLDFLKKGISQLKEIIEFAKKENDNTVFTKTVKSQYLNNNCSKKCYYPESIEGIEPWSRIN